LFFLTPKAGLKGGSSFDKLQSSCGAVILLTVAGARQGIRIAEDM
jgi:hypothetical protein